MSMQGRRHCAAQGCVSLLTLFSACCNKGICHPVQRYVSFMSLWLSDLAVLWLLMEPWLNNRYEDVLDNWV